MRRLAVLCLLAALACGCEKKGNPPVQPVRHDPKIDGSSFVTAQALNEELLQDQTKVSKNYQKLTETAPKLAPPASAPAVTDAPAEKPPETAAKPTPGAKAPPAAQPPATPTPASTPVTAVNPSGPPPVPPGNTPTGVVRKSLRQSLRDEMKSGQGTDQ